MCCVKAPHRHFQRVLFIFIWWKSSCTGEKQIWNHSERGRYLAPSANQCHVRQWDNWLSTEKGPRQESWHCLLYPLAFWVVRCDRAPSDGGLNEPLEPDVLWGTDMLLLVDERIWALLKRHLQQTLTYWSAFFSFGLCISFLGPTILDLRCQTQSTLEQITWVFFSQQFFLLVGSCLGGLFKKTWVIAWFGYQEAPRKNNRLFQLRLIVSVILKITKIII